MDLRNTEVGDLRDTGVGDLFFDGVGPFAGWERTPHASDLNFGIEGRCSTGTSL
ncbi:hypothetical protein PBCVNY2B_385R [Paramecium bursaria Chlorella virus NY2B]|uniref:Uncharacterized protein n=1 Tax=Paramecium bursaria Chlorella virus NYs1 TaxID=83442 RepID=M1HHD2_9PHYC|nr:hypothetical protein FK949_gp143 [Paramecium bursaria Chlorella virus NYs1]AGE54213.1 hypothetical protein PBCVIL52s1_394R [Paramecium bursaria Chlorella virus IL-5-2s1]AGE54854.1 hypothetical protein PBCVMA1D_261R [Paramecium bursaria Chlorella virus MA1D]AGE58330.1 hypothetical protein PBCVNY2B_385R [Paramecium bursaria Chlorella virus NY2B]AGE58708.1 hypothetical protein PBCVNYs1_381R [Paramecium bursaria Chlorella virus NYs1]